MPVCSKLLIAAALLTLPGVAATWTQQQELLAANGAANDNFGEAVAVSGDTAVIGAPFKYGFQGTAYVYVRSANGWVLQQELAASDAAGGDNFGLAVAIDGDTIVIGAPSKQVGANGQQGEAYVFVRSGGAWTQQATFVYSSGATGDLFGKAVAISGNTAVVGESQGGNGGTGAAFVFVRNGTTWNQQQKLTATGGAAGDVFGYSVSVSNGTALIGAPERNGVRGSAFIFTSSGGTWSQVQELTASNTAPNDEFGISVSIDGDTALIGAHAKTVGANTFQGEAYVFVRSSGWSEQQRLTASDGATNDFFGVSVSVNGDTALIGTLFKNAAYVFTRKGIQWSQQQELTGSDTVSGDEFGISVSLSGVTAVIGADSHKAFQGSAYVFATSYADSYQIGYAANLPAGGSVVNLTNAGTRNGYDPAGSICANVYVFGADQQLIACCACYLTPNHLKSLSVKQDLVNNTLTPGSPTSVSVAILASDPLGGTTCDAASVNTGGLEQGLRTWSTTVHQAPGGGNQVTETRFQNADLSATELSKLATYCGFIQANGSGYGICNSCQTGSMGATRQ